MPGRQLPPGQWAALRGCCSRAPGREQPQGSTEPLGRHTLASALNRADGLAGPVHHHIYLLPVGGSMLARPRMHDTPGASLLPFLGGAFFGALGLAAWQSVQAESPGLPGPKGFNQSLPSVLYPPITHPHLPPPQPSLHLKHQQAAPHSYDSSQAQGSYAEPWHTASHQPHLDSAAQSHPGQQPHSQGLWQLVSWPWGGWGTSPGSHSRRGSMAGHHPPKHTSVQDPLPSTTVTLDLPVVPASARSGPASTCSSLERPPLVPHPHISSTGAPGSDEAAYDEPLTRGSISVASAAVAPGVVHVVVGEAGAAMSPSARFKSSSGSGFVYDSRGFILTNTHVVSAAVQAHAASDPSAAGPGQQLSITMHDGRVCHGHVVAMDRVSDVAVVKAEIGEGEAVPVVQVGRSSRLKAGEWVVALGTPLMLKQSVTAGIVSCVERRASELGLEGGRTAYIQTDAAINQGNSGGPLVNLDGQVVGMNVFKAVAADGVSFAIPMDTVCEVVRQFHDHGRVIRPFVGVTLVEVTNGALKALQHQIPQLAHAKAAVMLQAVREGSPAQEAGLLPEDILVTLDGQSGLSMSEMVEVFGRSVGRPVSCCVIRRAADPSGTPSLMTLHLTPKEAAE